MTSIADGATLRGLLQPVSLDAFWAEHWELAPLILMGDRPGRQDGVFSMADLDRLLANGGVPVSAVGLVESGHTLPLRTPASGLPDSDALLELALSSYAAGASMVFRSVHERHPPLRQLCERLARDLKARINVNAYLTPRGSQALLPHHDTHDVIVIQIEGTKRWRLYESPVELPTSEMSFDRERMVVGPVTHDFTLEPWDLLYLPRGIVHDAHSDDQTSLHLTIGVYPKLWAELLRDVVQGAIEEQVELRRSVPFDRPGAKVDAADLAAVFDGLVQTLGQSSVAAEVLAEVAVQARMAHVAPGSLHRLLDIEELSNIDSATPLCRRLETDWLIERADGHVALTFNGKSVQFPSFVEPQLRYVAETGRLRLGDLPAGLDETSGLVLLRRLVKEGFLSIGRATRSTSEAPH